MKQNDAFICNANFCIHFHFHWKKIRIDDDVIFVEDCTKQACVATQSFIDGWLSHILSLLKNIANDLDNELHFFLQC